MASNTRKLYYPNPEPDDFYSGNTKSETYVGLRQNYYSWQWGNSLFVVLDPYWYTTVKTGWGVTLGEDQYNWFKNILESSHAKFKFVFCHNLVGGGGKDMRGGVEYADLYEWGGKDTNGVWGFDANRPGWGKPIHQLMVENGVTAFFHGHDHLYAKEEKDGIIYQEVPQPSNRNITNTQANNYGYFNGTILPGRGYLLVSVTDTSAKVDYIKTLLPSEEKNGGKNLDIADTYTIIKSGTTSITEDFNTSDIDISVSPNPGASNVLINVKLQNAEDVKIEIVDLAGNVVNGFDRSLTKNGELAFNYNCKDFYGNELANGTYFCRIISSSSIKSYKFSIMH